MSVYILFTNYCERMSIVTLRLKIVIFLTFSLIQSIVVVVVVAVSLLCVCVEPLNVVAMCLITTK